MDEKWAVIIWKTLILFALWDISSKLTKIYNLNDAGFCDLYNLIHKR